MSRVYGFVRWFDKMGDDGMLTDFNGNEWYFNSWSFPKTHYRVTGKCKKTGRKKTISTRKFPGLFLERREIPDPKCENLSGDTPVSFQQASGIDQRWAVEIKIHPEMTGQVWEHHVETVLETMLTDQNPAWQQHYHWRLNRLLDSAPEVNRARN